MTGWNLRFIFKFGDKEVVYKKTTIIPPIKIKIKAIPIHLDKVRATVTPKNKAKKIIAIAIEKGVEAKKIVKPEISNKEKNILIKLKCNFQHTYFATTYL